MLASPLLPRSAAVPVCDDDVGCSGRPPFAVGLPPAPTALAARTNGRGLEPLHALHAGVDPGCAPRGHVRMDRPNPVERRDEATASRGFSDSSHARMRLPPPQANWVGQRAASGQARTSMATCAPSVKPSSPWVSALEGLGQFQLPLPRRSVIHVRDTVRRVTHAFTRSSFTSDLLNERLVGHSAWLSSFALVLEVVVQIQCVCQRVLSGSLLPTVT